MGTSFIYDAVRTPFGRIGRALAAVRPDDLASYTLDALTTRHVDFDPGDVDEIFFGAANQAGEDNRNVGRMAALLALWPTSVPAVTVNRLCGSGLESVIQASRAVEVGDSDLVVAGGVESMSRAPWVLPKPERGYPTANESLYSTTLGWRQINPRMPRGWTIPLGESAEILADRYGITRENQDEFALRSHALASKAWSAGIYDREVVAVPSIDLLRDENIRSDASAASLATLRPSFRSDGTVTAGNASPLTDGASALLIGSERASDFLGGIDALARISARASIGNDPDVFGIAPVEAANRALERAGRTWADVDVVELNEAFAAQALACLHLWPDLDPAKVNIHGGAIALGHPLGASGGRIVGHAAHELARRGGGVAVVAICIGVGQGLAVVLER